MRKLPFCIVAAALLFLLPMASTAEPQCHCGVTFTPHEVSPLTIRFHEVSIGRFFRVVETLTGTPFRVPAELDYKVTFDIRHVPACHVLEIIGESLSLTYRQEGDTIVVIPPEPEPPPIVPPAMPKQP
jgi:hypothetical protein